MFKWTVLLSCAGLAVAQIQPPLRVGSRLITVDVVVRNDQGAVKGLTRDDFTLLDKGKAQEIGVFTVTEAASPANSKPTPLQANVASNRMNRDGEESRTATVILFDRLNIPAPLDQAV